MPLFHSHHLLLISFEYLRHLLLFFVDHFEDVVSLLSARGFYFHFRYGARAHLHIVIGVIVHNSSELVFLPSQRFFV